MIRTVVAIFVASLCQLMDNGIAQTCSPRRDAVTTVPILSGSYSPGGPIPARLTVMSWNIERGRRLGGIIEFIDHTRPDLCLLQEVDLNAQRTGKRNIADEIARRFGMNYVWGCEFQELGQGSRSAAAYQGQAVVTTLPIRSARVLRFSEQSQYWAPRWFLPNWSILQRRNGGRMALVAEIEAGSSTLVVYDIHLESRDGEALRDRQFEEILADIGQYPPGACVIVAGDLNTKRRPSSITVRLREAGFRDAVMRPDIPTSIKGTTIDWIFIRGPLDVREATINREIRASDHFPVIVELLMLRKGQPEQIHPTSDPSIHP